MFLNRWTSIVNWWKWRWSSESLFEVIFLNYYEAIQIFSSMIMVIILGQWWLPKGFCMICDLVYPVNIATYWFYLFLQFLPTSSVFPKHDTSRKRFFSFPCFFSMSQTWHHLIFFLTQTIGAFFPLHDSSKDAAC